MGDGSMNFKHLVDSSLGLLISVHEREVAAMKAENRCLQEVLAQRGVSVPRHGYKDQAPSADLAKSTTTACEHASVSTLHKEGHSTENGHSCSNGRDLGAPHVAGPAATGQAWDSVCPAVSFNKGHTRHP